MLNGTEKTPALISDYKEYHTDTTVKFVVKMTEEKLAQAEAAGLHKVFKLQTSLTCNSMVTFLCLITWIVTVTCWLGFGSKSIWLITEIFHVLLLTKVIADYVVYFFIEQMSELFSN